MTMQEKSTIKGEIIGDEGGLGKTIQILNLICHRADTGCAPFYPTLIVAPSRLVDTWFHEALRFHNKFTILLFYGYVGTEKTKDRTKRKGWTKKKGRTKKKGPTKKSCMVDWDKLNERLKNLSSNDRQTGRTLIITSYLTFERRTFKKIGSALFQPSHDNDNCQGRRNFADENDSEDDDEDLSKGNDLKTYGTIWGHRLERVILDEGHAVKNIMTKVHQSIAQCPINCRWIITATSMVNHTRDMRGFLSLLFRPEWNDSLDPREGPNFVKIYAMCDAQNEKGDLHLLDPELFRHTFSRGNLSEKDALIVLPRILRKLQLKRCIDSCMQVLEKTIVIGAEIPPYHIKTIEVVMSTDQQKEYTDIHRSLTTNLKRGGIVVVTDQQAEDMGGCYDMRVYRRLRHASFAFGLERVYKSTIKREGNLAKDIIKWKATPGGDLIWLLSRIMQRKASSIPRDRSFIAKNMINTSPKFPTLLAIANKVVIQDKRPLLVFLHYPLPQFQTISFLRTCGFKVCALSSGMIAREKFKVVQEFNSGKIEILVVTYATCSDFNFQSNCCDVVFLEPAFSINAVLRAIGRVHRFEQKREQNIWIVSAAHTFDRFVEFTQARKMVPQIIGTGAESFADLDTGLDSENGLSDDEEFDNEGGDNERDDNERDDNEKSSRSQLLEERADGMLQELLGQPSSRLEFRDKEDLGLSPEEESEIEGETGNMEAEEAEEAEAAEEVEGVEGTGDFMGMGGSGSWMKSLESKNRKAKDIGLSESGPMSKRCHSV